LLPTWIGRNRLRVRSLVLFSHFFGKIKIIDKGTSRGVAMRCRQHNVRRNQGFSASVQADEIGEFSHIQLFSSDDTGMAVRLVHIVGSRLVLLLFVENTCMVVRLVHIVGRRLVLLLFVENTSMAVRFVHIVGRRLVFLLFVEDMSRRNLLVLILNRSRR
jgi:hypothetical protein